MIAVDLIYEHLMEFNNRLNLDLKVLVLLEDSGWLPRELSGIVVTKGDTSDEFYFRLRMCVSKRQFILYNIEKVLNKVETNDCITYSSNVIDYGLESLGHISDPNFFNDLDHLMGEFTAMNFNPEMPV